MLITPRLPLCPFSSWCACVSPFFRACARGGNSSVVNCFFFVAENSFSHIIKKVLLSSCRPSDRKISLSSSISKSAIYAVRMYSF